MEIPQTFIEFFSFFFFFFSFGVDGRKLKRWGGLTGGKAKKRFRHIFAVALNTQQGGGGGAAAVLKVDSRCSGCCFFSLRLFDASVG